MALLVLDADIDDHRPTKITQAETGPPWQWFCRKPLLVVQIYCCQLCFAKENGLLAVFTRFRYLWFRTFPLFHFLPQSPRGVIYNLTKVSFKHHEWIFFAMILKKALNHDESLLQH